VPAQHKALSDIIGTLAKVHVTPSFEPHVTVLSGLEYSADPRKIQEAVTSAIAVWQSERTSTGAMRLGFHGIEAKDNFFYQSLIMHTQLNPDLDLLRTALHGQLIFSGLPLKPPTSPFTPHLSLMYSSKVTANQKAVLLTTLRDNGQLAEAGGALQLAGLSNFEAMELLIVRSQHGPSSWEVLDRIKLSQH